MPLYPQRAIYSFHFEQGALKLQLRKHCPYATNIEIELVMSLCHGEHFHQLRYVHLNTKGYLNLHGSVEQVYLWNLGIQSRERQFQCQKQDLADQETEMETNLLNHQN